MPRMENKKLTPKQARVAIRTHFRKMVQHMKSLESILDTYDDYTEDEAREVIYVKISRLVEAGNKLRTAAYGYQLRWYK